MWSTQFGFPYMPFLAFSSPVVWCRVFQSHVFQSCSFDRAVFSGLAFSLPPADILAFSKFFSDCRYVPYLPRYSPINLSDGAQMANFWRFFASSISVSRVQHVSDLPPKFTLRPHHAWNYGRHPVCDG